MEKIEFDPDIKIKLLKAKKELETKKIIIIKKLAQFSQEEKNIEQKGHEVKDSLYCPTCLQEVSEEYKEQLERTKRREMQNIESMKKKYLELESKIKNKECELEKKEEIIILTEQKFQKYIQKKKDLETKEKEKESISKRLKELKKEEEEKEKNISIKLARLKQLEELIKKEVLEELIKKEEEEKNKLHKIRLYERDKELSVQRFKTKKEFIIEQTELLKKTIIEKKQIQKKIEELEILKNWIGDFLTPLLIKIEQQVLFKIHEECDEHFKKGFMKLVNDDSFCVRLDQDFTPIIVQNGFDANFENLSGGEKTSVALAYRLALNKSLNTYFSSIQTKNLLILDEPTNGFSTEQIDNLRTVLEDMKLEQTIIVSHEERLSQIAHKTILVEKTDQESKARS
jgi:DNA repair protein SbcC/Rad50